jgi:hypothetical protein
VIVLLSVVAVVCGLIIAMVAEEKRQIRKRRKKVKEYVKIHNKTLRLWKWSEAAREWREEQKKPVKVQFD